MTPVTQLTLVVPLVRLALEAQPDPVFPAARLALEVRLHQASMTPDSSREYIDTACSTRADKADMQVVLDNSKVYTGIADSTQSSTGLFADMDTRLESWRHHM